MSRFVSTWTSFGIKLCQRKTWWGLVEVRGNEVYLLHLKVYQELQSLFKLPFPVIQYPWANFFLFLGENFYTHNQHIFLSYYGVVGVVVEGNVCLSCLGAS